MTVDSTLDVIDGLDAPGTTLERAAAPRAPWSARVARLGALVLLVGLLLTAVVSWACYSVDARNESRLLRLQTQQAGTLLQVALPTIQTPLAAAAELAASTDGDAGRFDTYMAPYVGTKASFVSASLWRVEGGGARMVATAGAPAKLVDDSRAADAFVTAAAASRSLSVADLLGSSTPRLGYAFASSGGPPSYVVYAESALPADRRASTGPNAAFADLRFVLYLGRTEQSRSIVLTNVDRLPLTGRTAKAVVPFGNRVLTLVASPSRQLGGSFAAELWWIVALAGGILSLAAAAATERLVWRRRVAERLGREVGDLLGRQRSIAEELQRALLPLELPRIDGVDFAVRYVPGVSGVDIGGDWYDVIEVGPGRFFFTVGDVSGRGVSAGAVMASLRFATRGFVSEGHEPAAVLDALSRLLDVGRDAHFATVLCGVADVEHHEVTIANAGHLPPLLLAGREAEFVETRVGAPIGAGSTEPYASVTVAVPPGGTVLVYTDGLVERPRENIDTGLGRLRDLARRTYVSVEELIGAVVDNLAQDGYSDDTAILGVQWLE